MGIDGTIYRRLLLSERISRMIPSDIKGAGKFSYPEQNQNSFMEFVIISAIVFQKNWNRHNVTICYT